MLIKVALPQKLSENPKPRSRRVYIRKRGKEVHNILCTAIPDVDIRKQVLSSILKHNYNADIYFDKVKRQQLLVVDCIAIRIKNGHAISNEAVCRLLEDYNRYLQRYGMLRVKHPLPGSCRQKMGKVEGVGSLPVGHQLIECSTSLSKTESCMHYWIK